jgi:hypothetical protein
LHDPKVDKLLRQLDSTEIPDETQVLVGYCTGENHRNWISGNIKNMRYNIRYGNGYNINGKMASARYLVLYTDNDFLHQEIFRVKPDSTRIYTKDEMKVLKYKNPSHPLYLVFELAEKIQLDATYHFDKLAPVLANKLAELESHHRPFTLNLLELAQVRILNN